jgi:cytidylate kinase
MMAIITISKGSYGYGNEVATKLAKRLGYTTISREVLLDASDQFKIPEIKLVKAIEDAPSIIDRFSRGKEKYVAYIRVAFLKHMQKDNVIYHGFAGHFFLRDVPNICKVRIIADMKLRALQLMKRLSISADKAPKYIKKIDDSRRKWSMHLYGIDTWDPNLYDMVFRIEKMTVRTAVDTIANAAEAPCFKLSPKTRKILSDLYLDAQVRANLVQDFPTTRYVSAEAGKVTVLVEIPRKEKQKVKAKVEDILKGLEGMRELDIRFKH